MTREKGGLIETMQESGLRPMESYRYMITEAGGEDCIGHTIRDHLNYCNGLKMKPIEGGDAQAVIDKLYQNMSDDMEFFFRVRVDGYGRVSSIFWRDSMMKEDYNIYGDVTIFDTTYRTNSESTNNAIGFRACKTTSLNEFFAIYEATIKRWRSIEESNEFICSNSIPRSNLPMCGLLKHAAEVYTHTLFRHFEQEFEASMTSEVIKCSVIGNILLYEVRIEDNNNTTEQVTYIQNDETITCTCKCFEETGLLCYHAIRILHGNSVKRIPEKYILSRWTKFAKKEVWDKVEAEKKEQGIINNYTPWRLHMARKFYNLILKSHTNEQARKIMEDSYTANLLAIDALLSVESTEQIEEDMEQENSESSTTTVLDPARSKTKGRNKRKKGHYDKHKNKKKKKKNSITTTTTNNSNKPREFGANTPKHLL
ncbi:Protein FAR1-RELATED SEQUENCE 5 [Bienertia sinuspersici]